MHARVLLLTELILEMKVSVLFLLMIIKAMSKPLQHSESKPIIFMIQRDWKTIYVNVNSFRKEYRLRRYPNQRLDLGRQNFVGLWLNLAGPSSF